MEIFPGPRDLKSLFEGGEGTGNYKLFITVSEQMLRMGYVRTNTKEA